MTEELRIILEMVSKTTEMGLAAFIAYLFYALSVTLIKFGLPCLAIYKIVALLALTDEPNKRKTIK